MRSDELAEKLGKHFALFGQGKEKKIKHKDLNKIIAKLTALRDGLTEEAAATKAAKKAERVAKQRDNSALLLDRAAWLQAQLAPADTDDAPAEAPEPPAEGDTAQPEVAAQD